MIVWIDDKRIEWIACPKHAEYQNSMFVVLSCMSCVVRRVGPQRVQIRRDRKWQNVDHPAVIIDRRSKDYGNPFLVGVNGPGTIAGDMAGFPIVLTRIEAVAMHRAYVRDHPELIEKAKVELADRDVACWCGPDEECHGDTWLEVANG